MLENLAWNMSGPMQHNQSPLPSPTVPQSGGMMAVNRHHLRVQHPGYSPHTTPHHSPSVYTPTTTQQNVFQFHEGMHHPNMDELTQQTANVAMHSPNVPLQSPSMPLHSPNVAMPSPNVPLQSPNVPQSPGHRYMQQQRFNFPPNVDALQIKTETPSSPFAYQEATSQASPANLQQVPLRYQAQNAATTDAMLNAISSYTDSEMLREGFEVPNTTTMADSLMTGMTSQQSQALRGQGGDFDLFEADNSLPDAYLDQPGVNLPTEPFAADSSNSAFSISSTDLSRTTAITSSTASSVVGPTEGKMASVSGLSAGKTRGVGRGRGGRQPGHRPNLVCQICGKKFNNSSAIAKHKLTHSDERKYACTICSKAFKRQDHLNGHMLTHRDKKPYECKFENCDKSYSDARSLRRHLENHHSMVEQGQAYNPRVAQYGANYQAGSGGTQSGGQYFQFDSRMQQQFQQQDTAGDNWRQFRSGDRSPGYVQQVSPISPAPGANPTSPLQTQPPQRPPWSLFDEGPKTVECSLCHRRFKNVPALNGHMRLHGGYFKKDEPKPEEKHDEVKKETTESGQMLPPVQATFSQKSGAPPGFQKPAPLDQPKYSLTQDLSRKYDDDVIRLQKLALMDESPVTSQSQLRLEHMTYLGQGQGHLLHSVLANQEPPVAAAMTLAEMSITRAMQQQDLHQSRDDLHQSRDDLPGGSILERRLLGYSDYSQMNRFERDEQKFAAQNAADRQLSIKSPTSGTLFSFPERPPSQSLATSPQETERKRHLSADADKFTSPKRLNDYETEYNKQPYSRTMEDNLFPRPKEPAPVDFRARRDDPLSRSCPSGALFRNPGEPPSNVIGRRRKPRPEPLFIPPHVNHFGFHSRLRSPRLWDKLDRGMTPPPYTPPPMLSPARKGCGLFWTIQGYRPVTPKSAPITPKLPPVRLGSTGDETDLHDEYPTEEDPPPATDIKPHVNVGSQYQADIPEMSRDHRKVTLSMEKEDLVWCPDSVGDNSLDEIQCYMDFACCAAVPGSGTNKEYAVHLLHYSSGDIQRALTLLMLDQPQFPKGHVLSTFKYDETDQWSTDDIDSFHNALLKCDKDFYSIGRQCYKSTKQCIEFYYLWKKVCPDEYKRLRILRRKKEAEELYNLRSKQTEESQIDTGSQMPEIMSCLSCSATFTTRQALIEHERVHVRNSPSPVSLGGQVPSPSDDFIGEEFPCKVCGKVFYKVKSRNAHMKRHRQTDHGKHL